MDQKIYNIYCDESRVENEDSDKMTIGALFVLRSKKNKVVRELKRIYIENEFSYELKWSKVGDKYFDFYKKIIDYFLNEPDLSFRVIVVDKKKVKKEVYHKNDSELAFFKFYYFMLRSRLLDDSAYYIFLDKKPTRDKNRARALHSFLDSYILWHKKNCNIRHLQSYSSDKSVLIQFSDLLTGLFGYECNKKAKKGTTKYKLVEYFKEKTQIKNLCTTSFLKETKCNIFVWNDSI
jgi:hypothetical protein